MAKKEYTEGDLVEIRFLDIVDENSWTDVDRVRTIPASKGKVKGQFLNEDDTVIRLVFAVTEDKDCSYIILPKGIITGPIRRIEEDELFDFGEDKD